MIAKLNRTQPAAVSKGASAGKPYGGVMSTMSDVQTEGAKGAVGPVRLGDVCRLAGDRQLSLTAAERQARRGPYPLYAENCASSGIDEYAVDEGGAVMVSAFGQVLANTGHLIARYEPGPCAATEHVHALVPHDPADGRYLWRVLTTTPKAARLVTGTSQVRQISGSALLTLPIPWPCRATRDAYVDALDGMDRRAEELAALVPRLLAEGDEAFARMVLPSTDERVACGSVADWQAGTNVPAADRAPDKPVRVEGPQGRLGRCDEALTCGPALMVGPAGRRLLLHYVDEPAHPIAEMRYVVPEGAQVPLSVIFFALRAAGLFDRLRLDGKQLDGPRYVPADLPGIEVCVGTPEARAAFAEVGADVLARVAQAGRDADRLAADRRALVAEFVAHGTVDGTGSCEGCEAARGDLPEPRGVSCTPERARSAARKLAAEREQAAREVPGIPLDATSRAALGPLASLVEGDAFGLVPADAAWELAPLACVRVCAEPASWDAVVAAAEEDGCEGLVGALDAAMDALAQDDDLLSFLPNLSYQSSLLTPAQLAVWVRALDAVDPAAVAGSHVRAVFALEPGTVGMPAEVAGVFDRVLAAAASRMPAGFETAYVPCESCEGVVDAFARVLPDVTMRAQFDEFSHMLAAAMVRAVDLRAARGTRGGLGAAAGSALLADEFSDWRAPLVAAALPPNAGEWTKAVLSADDPRWVLGTPPRSRANYAWLQQALSHQEPGGLTVLLTCNSLLHSTTGSEQRLRRALAASGRVRLVAALPARVFADARPAASIVVLGDPDPSAGCLMVDALGLGEPNPDAPAEAFAGDVRPEGMAERVLPVAAAERVAVACEAWLTGSGRPDEPGFARVVEASAIERNDGLLTPWAYVR